MYGYIKKYFYFLLRLVNLIGTVILFVLQFSSSELRIVNLNDFFRYFFSDFVTSRNVFRIFIFLELEMQLVLRETNELENILSLWGLLKISI